MKATHLFFLFISLVSAVTAQQDQSLLKKLEKLQKHCEKHALFSGVLHIHQEGLINYTMVIDEGSGSQTPIQQSSVFNIGSVSKQFTSTAVLLLQERGKLALDDLVSKYIPNLPATATDVTLRHLLTHTSGFKDHYTSGIEVSAEITNESILAFLQNPNAHVAQPGERFIYCNGAYVLLALIVEQVSETPFPQFLEKELFAVAGLNNTFVYDGSGLSTNTIARGYNCIGQPDNEIPRTFGSGNVYSTTNDLVKWDAALRSETIISLEAQEQAYTSALLSGGRKTDYGLGWHVSRNETAVHHAGSIAGYRSHYFRMPQIGRTLVIVSNHGDVPAMQGIMYAVNSAFQGKLRLPRVSAADMYISKRQRLPVEKSIGQTKRQTKGLFGSGYHNEGDINWLGYTYLRAEMYADALALFQWNTEAFPNSWNTYDSMGDGLLAVGDTTQAVLYYTQSLALNPNNAHGIGVLNALGYATKDIVPLITLTECQMEVLTGVYAFTPQFSIEIFREGQQLFSKASSQRPLPIYPASETHFYLKDIDAQLTFEQIKRGKAKVLILHQGTDKKAKRSDS